MSSEFGPDPDSHVFDVPPGFSDDDIPTIGDDMLHPEVDFEVGMSAVPVVSLCIIVTCTLVFFVEVARGALTNRDMILKFGALHRPEVEAGGVWRMISCAFLHASPDHLIGNLIILYIVGIACEHAFGRLQFLTLYVLAAIAGSTWSIFGGKVSVGASGAIFGLVGAMITMLWKHKSRLHLRDRRLGLVLALWAGYQIFLGFLFPNIDNLAHIGGLLGGAVLGLLLRPAVLDGRAEVATHPTTQVGFGLACLALVATAGVFLPRLFS